MSPASLTPKQQRFVEEYCLDTNGTQAAIRAGYSPRTANEQAARLLAKASVKEAVRAAQQARSERLQITQDDVIRGLHQEATLAGPGSSHAARVTAWQTLGKHLGMFNTTKLDVNFTDGLADRLDAARKRIAQAAAGAVIEGVALPAANAARLELADLVADNGNGAVVGRQA